MSEIIVEIKQGLLMGKNNLDYKGRTYYSFQGIPYAKPPLGKLRFKAPCSSEPWDGVFDATNEGNECFSRHLFTQNIVGSEDCLFLNVYTPRIPDKTSPTNLKSVMFWIHGGAFICGSSKTELCGPDYLLTQDVVLVTVNYRIGLLGFLSFDDSSVGVPGNAGLKDVVMALEWVKKNISAFAGDPSNVTIFGESAGGAVVHYLMLSPLAKGLFHKAIAQSGCALNCWATGSSCVPELVKYFGLEGRSTAEVLQALEDVSVEELFAAQEKLDHSFQAYKPQSIGPVVEKPSNLEPNFITRDPIEIIKTGNYNRVPLLIGYTSREGMLFEAMQVDKTNLQVVQDFETVIPHNYGIKHRSKKSQIIAQRIKTFYYGDKEPNTENMDIFYKLITDSYFLEAFYRVVKLHRSTSSQSIYFYRMSLETQLNFFKNFANITAPGVCHGDDLGYLFRYTFAPNIESESIEDKGIRTFTKFWSNFARYGNPNGLDEQIWEPVTQTELNYLDIGEKLIAGKNPEEERMRFWESLQKYANLDCKL